MTTLFVVAVALWLADMLGIGNRRFVNLALAGFSAVIGAVLFLSLLVAFNLVNALLCVVWTICGARAYEKANS
ncbi:MAG: hypothetical protein Q8P76_04285 [bacterium]|nr:hypothetical protein [bacterium]